MYGDASDYYKEQARKGAVNKMVGLGYSESNLKEFETFELEWMHERIMEIRKQQSVDILIEKLNKL
jgi:hypothetical protein